MTIEMTRPSATPIDASPLRRLCGGQVYLPGDAGYDEARLPWNAAVDQRPAAVVYPRSATDVSRGRALRRRPRAARRPAGTGHNAGPLAAQGLDDVVVVRLSRLDEVTVDVERQVVRVGGGARLAARRRGRRGRRLHRPARLVARRRHRRLQPRRRHRAGTPASSASPRTTSPPWSSSTRRARSSAPTRRRTPQLFWAVRGGGGSFGVVTALEFRMFDFASTYGGMLVWDVSHAEEVLRAWAAWARRRPRRGHHLVPDPAAPAAARAARAGARPRPRGHRRRRLGGRGRRPADPRAAAGARPGDRHLRPRAHAGAGPAAHGPRGPDAGDVVHDDARELPEDGDPGVPGRGRSGGVDVAADVRDPPARRGARPAAGRGGRGVALRRASSWSSPAPSRRRRRWRSRATRTRSGSPTRSRRTPTAGTTSTSPRPRSTSAAATPRRRGSS